MILCVAVGRGTGEEDFAEEVKGRGGVVVAVSGLTGLLH